MKKWMAILLALLLVCLSACRRTEELKQVYVDEGPIVEEVGELRDVAILFTAGLGRSEIWDLARISDLWIQQGADYGRDYLALVDCGGALDFSGDMETVYDRLEGMNYLGYDAAVPDGQMLAGNVQSFLDVANMAQFPWLCGNLMDSVSGIQPLASWTMMRCGPVDVAFVGVCAPVELAAGAEQERNAAFSLREEEWVYAIRDAVDSARKAEVDYVIVLGCLGEDFARELISLTEGVDAYLDGSGAFGASSYIANKNGDNVLVSGIGGSAGEVGKLVIATDGSISAQVIAGYENSDEMAMQFLESLGYERNTESAEEE